MNAWRMPAPAPWGGASAARAPGGASLSADTEPAGCDPDAGASPASRCDTAPVARSIRISSAAALGSLMRGAYQRARPDSPSAVRALDTADREGDIGRDVWSGYSTRDAAQLAGLTESAVRSCARAGLLSPGAANLPARFSFQDLAVLKVVKDLTARGVSLPRVRRELAELRRTRGGQAGLSSLTLSAWGGHVVVRESGCAWQADSGQLLLDLGEAVRAPAAGGEVTAMPIRREAPPPEPAHSLTADQWFERPGQLEEG